MVANSPRLPAPFTIWFNALMFVGFIALMVLTIEGTLAWIAGSFAHSAALGFIVLAVSGLPTLYWLVMRCLRDAVRAERELLAPPPAG